MLSFETPIGVLTVIATNTGIRQVLFGARKGEAPNELERTAKRQILEYFAGERREFTVPLDRPESAGFRGRVQLALSSISFGQVKTYGELAKELGNPGAARAVGTACATNPLPILVPCHRVLAKRGLGGYLGGLPAKQYLLRLEGIHLQA